MSTCPLVHCPVVLLPTAPKSCFWVAVACQQPDSGDDDGTSTSDEVVGCVGLAQESESEAEMKRMSVSCRWHGYGIGTKLGHALQEHAKQHGLSEIYLVVTGVQDDARALYSKLNWVEVEGKTGFEGSCVSLHKYVYRPSEKE
eukprot:jgi/Chrzof1/4495/Cz14g15140.t1